MDKLRLGLSSTDYVGYAGIWLAAERCYFAHCGIDIEITCYQGGGLNQRAFETGKADVVHVNPANVALNRAAGMNERGFAALASRPDGYHLLVHADSPIQSMADLDGRTVGASAVGSRSAPHVVPIRVARLKRLPSRQRLRLGSWNIPPTVSKRSFS